ncbi:MAG: Nudix family hydrolase [Betaproteobacteria bacterium]|nr:Nudix family hydrolase [Betaproteobacteria bacterium]
MSTGGPIDVAAAIVERSDGRVLLARRPEGKAYAGFWEFPGGKFEPGEGAQHALARELEEELGIRVKTAYPWVTRVFAYPHATVRLHFHRVVDWAGEPFGREHQMLSWQRLDALDIAPLLPANQPIVHALQLPLEYGVSAAAGMGVAPFLRALDRALIGGLRLIQVREPGWDRDRIERLTREVASRAREHGAQVVLNGDAGLAHALGLDGIHLPARSLATLEERPDFAYCGASTHDRGELARAAALDLDYVVLGPVRETATHPGQAGLGWEAFADLARDCPMPVYAIGGLGHEDLVRARAAGAHGVAMLRGAWANAVGARGQERP